MRVMLKHVFFSARVALFGVSIAVFGSANAQIHLVSDEIRRAALEVEARIERMVMVPMQDGVRLASRIYIPKNASGPVIDCGLKSPAATSHGFSVT